MDAESLDKIVLKRLGGKKLYGGNPFATNADKICKFLEREFPGIPVGCVSGDPHHIVVEDSSQSNLEQKAKTLAGKLKSQFSNIHTVDISDADQGYISIITN